MRASSRGPVTTTPSSAAGAAPLPRCSSKRIEADFQEWRDNRDWTAEKYRHFARGRFVGALINCRPFPRSRSAWAKFDEDKPLAKREAMMRRE